MLPPSSEQFQSPEMEQERRLLILMALGPVNKQVDSYRGFPGAA